MEEKDILQDCPVPVLQHPGEFQEFINFYESRQPKKVLEIGSFYGGTLWFFLKHANLEKFVALDLPIPPNDERYKEMLNCRSQWAAWSKELMPEGELFDVQGSSHDTTIINHVRGLFPEKDLDVLHIDGDHSYNGVKADYDNFHDLVKPGGIIVFHDVFGIQEVNKFWSEITRQYHTIRQISHPGGWGIGILFVP